MCGLFASFEKTENQHLVQRALNQMSHRGPDGQMVKDVVSQECTMGHVRLSIVDLNDRSTQPFSNSNLHIVFNGEIYNFKLLKEDLVSKGVSFHTESDTEVLLELYRFYGTKCLNLIDGMFAFVIYDSITKEAFIARDRIGEKPLFFHHSKEKKLILSSEIGPLSTYLNLSKEKISEHSLSSYLFFGFTPAPDTIYEEIKILKPGYYLKYNSSENTLTQSRYYSFSQEKCKPISSPIINLKSLIDHSVKERIYSSDVPVATFLSGGIDSSIISYTASKYTDKISAYSVAYPEDPEFNEIEYAKLLIKRYPNLDHKIINITEKILLENIDHIITKLDHPYGDSSIIPTYILCSNVEEKTILGGDGADELFGGYGAYSSMQASLKLSSFTRNLIRLIPHSKNPANINNPFIRRLNFFLSSVGQDISHEYIDWRSYAEEPNLIALYSNYKKNNYLPQNIKTINDILNEDVEFNLHNDMLLKVDYAAMFNSLEVRSPFLDNDILNFASNLDPSFKVQGNNRKIILKKAYHEEIPHEILYRRKQGFLLPVRSWFEAGALNKEIQTLCENQNIFDRDTFSSIINEHSKRTKDHSSLLWFLYLFLKWSLN